MRNVLTIVRKELRAYFVSPIAYVVLTGFLLLGGWFFFNLLSRFTMLLSIYTQLQQGAAEQLNLNEFVIAPLMHNLSIVLVILVPMITMRAYAEEKKRRHLRTPADLSAPHGVRLCWASSWPRLCSSASCWV